MMSRLNSQAQKRRRNWLKASSCTAYRTDGSQIRRRRFNASMATAASVSDAGSGRLTG